MAIPAPTTRGQDTYKASLSQEERDKWQLDNGQWRDLVDATPTKGQDQHPWQRDATGGHGALRVGRPLRVHSLPQCETPANRH